MESREKGEEKKREGTESDQLNLLYLSLACLLSLVTPSLASSVQLLSSLFPAAMRLHLVFL